MSLEAVLVPGFYTGHISNGLVTPATAPIALSSTVITNGTELQIVFDRDVVIGAGGSGGWTANMSGGAATLTYDRGAGTRFLVYTWSRTIGDTETGDVDYTQPGDGLEDEVLLNDVVSFVDLEVTVGSEASFKDPTLIHNETSLGHYSRTLRHNRVTIEHND